MSLEHEPTRWSEAGAGAGPELAKLLGLAKSDTLEAEQIDSLARAVVRPTPVPIPRIWRLLGLGMGGIGVIVAGAWWLTPARPALLAKGGSVELPHAVPTAAPRTTSTTVLDLDESLPQKPSAPRPSASGISTEVQEFQLIRRARAALPTDPARALALARTHEKKFPNGVLVQEREVIVISALKKLGQTRDADQRADEFKKSHPNSAHNPKFDPEKAP